MPDSPASRYFRFPALFAALIALGSCSPRLIPPSPAPPIPPLPAQPPGPANAIEAGVSFGSQLSGLSPAQAERAYVAFRISCPALLRRKDASGLTENEDWRAACDERALPLSAQDRAAWFARTFTPARIGDGRLFATGYYEPEILGSRTAGPGYPVPVYAKPPDLVETPRPEGGTSRGRLVDGALILYHDRAEIEDGALAGRGLEIAWAADAVDLFFLQIQGSGRLRLPDGGVMRIGYASQNGRDYVGIGKLMKERGLLGPGQTSMQGIIAWLRAHPEEGRAIMRENKSYIFFNELTGPGPLGALGLPVTPRASVAADPKFVPLGAPVLLAADHVEASGLWIAQDTGGAIKGANRVDTFWGAGEDAKRIAGGMQTRGAIHILLPNSAAARLKASLAPARP